MTCRASQRGATRAAILCIAAALGWSIPAFGQNIPVQTREQLDIGREAAERLRERERADFSTETPQTEDDATAIDDASGAVTFRLEAVTFDGSTLYTPERLGTISESFVGTDITLGGLREIADRVEALYRGDGYVATRVIVPPQTIRNGRVTMQVFEGKIIHYEINGDIGPVKQQIARLLDNLLTDEPARQADIERYMLLARDLPGISLTGTLRNAGDSAPGGVVLVVDTALKSIDAFVNTANQSAEPTGPYTLNGGASSNSKTEFGERIGGILAMPYQVGEQMTAYGIYEQSLGNDGLMGRFEITASQARPGDLLDDLNLRTVTLIASAELEYPLVRSRNFSLWDRAGVEFLNEETSLDGVELFEDQFKVLYGGLRGVLNVPLGGQFQFDLLGRAGLDFLGHSTSNSRFDAQTDFALFRGEASFAQPLPPFFEMFLAFRGQLADRPLPSAEEFSLGELTIGRGYEPGTITGDSGFGMVGEVRYFTPGVEATWLDEFQVFGFFDYGRVYDRGNPTQNPDGFEELYSAGFGSRVRMFEDVFGEVYVAFPLTVGLSTSDFRPEPGLRFNLTKFF